MMDNIYNYILEGLKNSGYFYNPRVHGTFENYLQSLKKDAKLLWDSFRNNLVKVEYSNKNIQAVYLIRYYPHYVEMSLEVFRLLTTELTQQEQIKVCFFGSGPCPELVGLIQFLTEHSSIDHNIQAISYDINSQGWNGAREITRKYIIPQLMPKAWQGCNKLSPYSIDLCQKNSIKNIQKDIQNYNIFVFQNCLNELWNVENMRLNINDLLTLAADNSLIIISDLLYPQNLQIMKEVTLMTQSRKNCQIIQKSDGLMIRSSCPIPTIITENLLTREDKLIPKSSINFSYLVIHKNKNFSFDDNLDDIPF